MYTYILEAQADQAPHFSSEEIKKFERRYKNGYDLQHDEHYNLWLKQFHSSNTVGGIANTWFSEIIFTCSYR